MPDIIKDTRYLRTKEATHYLETPVVLVAGTPVKLREGPKNADAQTDGIVHHQEVYRIVWEFAKYRSVELGKRLQ